MEAVLAIASICEHQFNLEENEKPIILEGGFSSRTHPSIFTSKAPQLLERSTEKT